MVYHVIIPFIFFFVSNLFAKKKKMKEPVLLCITDFVEQIKVINDAKKFCINNVVNSNHEE